MALSQIKRCWCHCFQCSVFWILHLDFFVQKLWTTVEIVHRESLPACRKHIIHTGIYFCHIVKWHAYAAHRIHSTVCSLHSNHSAHKVTMAMGFQRTNKTMTCSGLNISNELHWIQCFQYSPKKLMIIWILF